MPVTSSQQLLDDLLQEIYNTDPQMLPPPAMPERTDKKVLGVLTDELIRKIFCLSSFYRREAKRLEVDLESDGIDISSHAQFHALKGKHELLQELFWYLLRTQLNHWQQGIGIRKGWSLVEITNDSDKPDLPPFLKKLLGDD